MIAGLLRSKPAGTILLQEGFDDSSLSSRGWYDMNGTVTIDTTPANVHSGGGSLQASFGSGGTRPPWLIARHLFTPTDTLYVSFWVKYSSNWIGSSESFHPHEINILSDAEADFDGLSDNYLNTYIEHNYQAGGIPRLSIQDNRNINIGASVFRTGSGIISGTDPVASTETRSVGGANGGVENGLFWENFAFGTAVGYYNDKRLDYSSVIPAVNWRNVWNHIEVYFQMNTIGGSVGRYDGVMRYTFNNAVLIDRSDILFRTNLHPTIKFKQFLISPYIGDGSPAAQTVWYDDLLIKTAP